MLNVYIDYINEIYIVVYENNWAQNICTLV